jgi:glyoxylase-like metal-dependent hydrolase (beta-lactamase superfamily II)
MTLRSEYFTVEQLGNGVYALIAAGAPADSNAGIIDMGDRTLVFDTFMTPKAANDLRDVAEQLTGRPVTYVINSHYHYDHIRGNQVFSDDAEVISTTRTRELIATKGMAQIDNEIANGSAELEKLEQQIEVEPDTHKRKDLAFFASEYRVVLESLPSLRLRIPNITFDTKMVFHGMLRTVELITLGGGHTESDAILYLPKERIAFLGDLLFVGYHPLMTDGNPQTWMHILERVEKLTPTTLVPGHGATGNPNDLTVMQHYISTMNDIAHDLMAGGDLKVKDRTALPAPFDSWGFSPFVELNLEFLCQRAGREVRRSESVH